MAAVAQNPYTSGILLSIEPITTGSLHLIMGEPTLLRQPLLRALCTVKKIFTINRVITTIALIPRQVLLLLVMNSVHEDLRLHL